ncbi:glycoside hydrolase family 10 protein [Dothidotthia symphoricarpi CBS 119687]|uniref:Beta-xylanase n=1 Tax=Dothidotthia symphoricarpi CBS 119687 TaxID=1392245 RepID=A0A6A6A754_9PLEO|nr:glycoside hydrolase family 10 protein [Dothidotthia symphoricarpi CBS 119687]KAF2127650.1 glycoside hydrolase family 10 protein [Dothidotthia symphoricarpi CBS 119687]
MKNLFLLLAPLLVAASPVERRASTVESLDTLYKGIGKIYFGAVTEQARLESGENANIIQSRFGQVTPEYSMKWDQTEPTRGQFTFATSDYLVNWAVQNGKSVRGHTLVWHEALPQWVKDITDKAVMQSVIETHISTVVGRYKGQIRAWDVVNEIFDGAAMRKSVFYNVLGEDFVGIAFRAARKADPSAKLYINDFDLEDMSYAKPPALVAKVKQWLSQQIPIDGIGSQTHLQAGKTAPIESGLRYLTTAGVAEVAVTELDIVKANPQEYRDVVQACYYVPTCVGITTWGIRDTDSYHAADTPLLFADSWAPKDAYYAIRDYLRTLQK